MKRAYISPAFLPWQLLLLPQISLFNSCIGQLADMGRVYLSARLFGH